MSDRPNTLSDTPVRNTIATRAPGAPEPSPAQLLRGWGRTAPSAARLVPVADRGDLDAALRATGTRGFLARGLGRSYGDAAQNAGGTVLDMTRATGQHGPDGAGRLRVAAGTSLDAVLRAAVPAGWFVPVTPGTRFVTVGGAIAADVHGKNHHRDGSFGEHVEEVRLRLGGGDEIVVGPGRDADAFWATVGGMGLTGVVTEAVVRMQPIETSQMVVDTERTTDLDDTMDRLSQADTRRRYSVAWLDLTAPRGSFGRGVVSSGDHARLADLPPGARAAPLAWRPGPELPAPPWVPPRLLSRPTLRTLCRAWYRLAPRRERAALQPFTRFFHPLDGIAGWNRLYGRPGFVQYQCAVPSGAERALRDVLHELRGNRVPSLLTVLKRFGPGNPGPLSFPLDGWTLAVDVPTTVPGLNDVLDRCDDLVHDAGGRLYLAKDARMRPRDLRRSYPELDRWRAVRERLDPGRQLCSDLARRLALLDPV